MPFGDWMAGAIARYGLAAATLALFLFGLTACAHQPSVPVVVAGVALPAVSDAEMTCAAEPAVPTAKASDERVRESALKGYIVDLRASGRDCRTKLEITRRTWRATEQRQREVSKAIPPQD